MTWQKPDSKTRMAGMVDNPGYRESELLDPAQGSVIMVSRLRHGPHMMGGDLCEVAPGYEAIILVSPSGERLLMQNEGVTTFHVPAGWRILVGTRPLAGGPFRSIELENIPRLYEDAAPYLPG